MVEITCVCACTSEEKLVMKNVLTHLPDLDRCANQVGDAWQRAALATLGVGDHPAVTALQ